MRIRTRFPSFPVIPSSVASSTEAPPQQEEMEVSSSPAPAEKTTREERVLTDLKDILARAHMLLGGSSHTANSRSVQPGVPEEHSTTGVAVNEPASELQSGNGRNKSLLEQENPTKTMVIKQGDQNEGKQKKWNYSGTGISKQKGRNVSSSLKGVAKEMFSGNSKYGKAETATSIEGRKERTKVRPLMEAEDDDEDEDGYSSGSIENKVKTRSLKSIYADIRSLMPNSSCQDQDQDSEESL